eukprot:12134386-Alexandrium_andersonii.AAC.1
MRRVPDVLDLPCVAHLVCNRYCVIGMQRERCRGHREHNPASRDQQDIEHSQHCQAVTLWGR